MACKVKNKELLKEIIKGKEEGRLTPKCQEFINEMTLHYAEKMFSKNPDYQKEVSQFTVNKIIEKEYWKQINPERSKNAFAYIAQIIKSCFAGHYRLRIKRPQ